MQSIGRQFGKIRNKGPGDNAKVTVLLKDYDDADQVLAKLIDGGKLWREAWFSIVVSQLAIATEYYALYDPIVGASDGHGRDAIPTPELQLTRTFKVKQAYEDLRTELLEEVTQIEERMLKPAMDARDCIAPIRRTIKKRENKRLDLERCQDKVNKLQRKAGRTAKEESALGKAEDELSVLVNEFEIADVHLRDTLPPLITATFSLVPPLLAEHILIQNRLLGLYYTTVHAYCEEVGLPSPPPPMDEVVAGWNYAFTPVQREVESLGFISRGRAVQMSMSLGADGQPHQSSVSPQATTPQLGFRRSYGALRQGSSSNVSSNNGSEPPQRGLRIPSVGSLTGSYGGRDHSPQPSPSPSYRRPDFLSPTDFTTATVLGRSPEASPNSLRPRNDYFSGNRPTTASTIASNMSQLSLSNGAVGAAAKKKKPPPPPPKRIPSGSHQDEYVVALFPFAGQSAGDLSFREGDVIKIIKKTDTDQDWWDGELAGTRGKFPANYTRAR